MDEASSDPKFDPRDVLTRDNRRLLRQLLHAYLSEALQILTRHREWPRPFTSPLQLRRTSWTTTEEIHLSDTNKALQTFLRESGIGDRLHSTGHGWSWHQEVFADLFVELYASRAVPLFDKIDGKAFESLFQSAWAEISRNKVHLRQVAALTGTPLPKTTLHLQDKTRVLSYDLNSAPYELSKLLATLSQRDIPTLYPEGSGILVCQDEIFERDPEGEAILRVWDRFDARVLDFVLALRLCSDSTPQLQTIYTAQLSTFPLFPLTSGSGRDYGKGYTVSWGAWTPSFTRRLNAFMHKISHANIRTGELATVVDRFVSAYSFSEQRQNIIDLVVCLESLYDTDSELRYKLATRVAALLGRNAEERVKIYNYTYSAYGIRNTLVHGKTKGDVANRIKPVIHEIFPRDAESDEPDDMLRSLVGVIRDYVRITLGARVLHARWPKENDWPTMVFDLGSARSWQKSLGLPRART